MEQGSSLKSIHRGSRSSPATTFTIAQEKRENRCQ
jgi:hypothetical protein